MDISVHKKHMKNALHTRIHSLNGIEIWKHEKSLQSIQIFKTKLVIPAHCFFMSCWKYWCWKNGKNIRITTFLKVFGFAVPMIWINIFNKLTNPLKPPFSYDERHWFAPWKGCVLHRVFTTAISFWKSRNLPECRGWNWST